MMPWLQNHGCEEYTRYCYAMLGYATPFLILSFLYSSTLFVFSTFFCFSFLS